MAENLRNRRFWTPKTTTEEPYISPQQGGYRLQISITRGHRFKRMMRSLDKLKDLRDICIFERDFLKLRGLSYT